MNGKTNWYNSYVEYGIANGILDKSYANYTRAQMNAPATRREFVSIFYPAMDGYKALNNIADNAIPDVKLGDKCADEIYAFYRAGILTGSDKQGTFNPDSTIVRSEVAASKNTCFYICIFSITCSRNLKIFSAKSNVIPNGFIQMQ